jgi:ribonuclease D
MIFGLRILLLLLAIFAKYSLSFKNQCRQEFTKKTRFLKDVVVENSDILSERAIAYITDQIECDKAVAYMVKCNEIALDLEFDQNRYAYGTTLCLIQVNCDGNTYILDPLSDINLHHFYRDVIENEKIEKIIHAPSEDIRIMQSFGIYPKSIFDSERCAKLLNFSRTSLASVTNILLNVTLDKSEQTSNWLKRPLSDKQIEYAALDVLYLRSLKKILLQLANDRGIVEWLQEENAAWSTFRVDVSEESNMRVSKKETSRLSEFEIHCYRELLTLRDKYSRNVNKPPHFVIPKELLIDMCLSKNKNVPIIFKTRREVHPTLRKVTAEREFTETLRKARVNARELKLSTVIPTSSSYDLSDVEKKVISESRFSFLYDKLCDMFGKATASYMLPNKVIVELAMRRISIEDLEFAYRRKIFTEVLQEIQES